MPSSKLCSFPKKRRTKLRQSCFALIDDQRWEELLNHPKTEALLDILSAEGDAEDAAGLTRPLSESYE